MYTPPNTPHWRPLHTVLASLPSRYYEPCTVFLATILIGPGLLYKEAPELIKKYATEVYCVAMAANTILLEWCFTSTSYLAFTAPIFLIIHLGGLALEYGRVLIECAVISNEPSPQKDGSYKEGHINIANASFSGSVFYRNMLSLLRRPWSIDEANFIISIRIFSLLIYNVILPQNLAVTLLRFSQTLALDIFLFIKWAQASNISVKLNELQAWVEAASEEEKPSRQLARQRIWCYLQEALIDPDPTIKPDREVSFLGIHVLIKKIPDYKLSFAHLKLTSLPDIIWHLTTLQELDVEGNQLTDISKQVVYLPYLEKLNVRYNQLCTLPEELAYHPNLTQLKTTGNTQLIVPEQIVKQSRIAQDTNSRCVLQ